MTYYIANVCKILGTFIISVACTLAVILLRPEFNSIDADESFALGMASFSLMLISLIYFLSATVITHIVVACISHKKRLISKNFINCIEYSYLILGALSVISIISASRDISSAYADFDKAEARDRINTAISIIDNGESDICKRGKEFPHFNKNIEDMCNWYRNAHIFLDGKRQLPEWGRLYDEHNEIRSQVRTTPGDLDEFSKLAKYLVQFEDATNDIELGLTIRPHEYITPPSIDVLGAFAKIFGALAAGFAVALRLGKLSAEVLKIVG